MERVIPQDNRQRTLRNIKTASMLRARSKPPIEGQSYLDLYVLQRDRARWERLRQQAVQMMESIDLALKKLGLPQFVPAGPEQPKPASPRPKAASGGLDFKVCTRKKRTA